MSDSKNPEREAENPAPMPRAQQGHAVHPDEPEGQQGGTHGGKRARMAPLPESPPGQEQDAHGNVIPFEQRTKDDQERARSGKPG